MKNPPFEIVRMIGLENTELLWESLQDVMKTGWGEVRVEIVNGSVRSVKAEVSRLSEQHLKKPQG